MGNFKIKINPSSARQHRGIAQGSQRDAARSRCLSFSFARFPSSFFFFYLISSGLPVEFGLLEHVPEYAERVSKWTPFFLPLCPFSTKARRNGVD
jgi:hypothetical protein